MTPITRVGHIAHRILQNQAEGRVIAVFDRSAYVEIDDQLICLISPGLHDGPLTVTCRDLDAVRLGARYTPNVADARVWQPPKPYGWTSSSMARGLDALRSAVVGLVPSAGLGTSILDDSMLSTRAGLPIARLRAWLANKFEGKRDSLPREVGALVGLGPGLTPSGDDFLGGVLVATHALGRGEIAELLYEDIQRCEIGDISAAHLAAASEGTASEPLHLLLNDILCGRAAHLPARLAALSGMGHTSGWDAFAGIVVVLQAAASAQAANFQAA